MKPLSKTKTGPVSRVYVDSPEWIDIFSGGANEFTGDATKSKDVARATLIAEGIYTKSGRLGKNYR